MKKIYLNKDKRAFTMVDDCDYEELSKYHWMLGNHGYAYRQISMNGRVISSIALHRQIIEPHDDLVPDHIDRNKLNNQRSNLRLVTQTENNINRRLQKNNTTGERCIILQKSNKNPFQVKVKRLRKTHYLGVYSTLEAAVMARDKFVNSWAGA